MDLENQDKLQSIINWAIANDIDEERLPRDIKALSQITELDLSNLNLTSLLKFYLFSPYRQKLENALYSLCTTMHQNLLEARYMRNDGIFNFHFAGFLLKCELTKTMLTFHFVTV